MKFILDKYSVLLLDMNGTFIFGEDRFGVTEDFYATYRAVGGERLNPSEVNRAIRDCYEGMLNLCKNPQHFDNFPSLAEGLQRYAFVPASELHLLETVFTMHELGASRPLMLNFCNACPAAINWDWSVISGAANKVGWPNSHELGLKDYSRLKFFLPTAAASNYHLFFSKKRCKHFQQTRESCL
jgi:hypothetical protein